MTRTKKQAMSDKTQGFIAGVLWTNTPLAAVFIVAMFLLSDCGT